MQRMAWMIGGMGVLALAVCGAWADEEKIPLDKLPKAVSDAFKVRFPKAEFVEAVKETEDGKTEFEISLKKGGMAIDLMVSLEGKITLIEKTIPVEDLPLSVAAGVAAKHPSKKVTKAEEVIKVSEDKETLEYYEVIVEVDGKPVEVQVLTNGKLKPEAKKEEKKD